MVMSFFLPFLVTAAAAMQPASRGQMKRAKMVQMRGWMTPSTRMLTTRLGSSATRGL